MTETLSLFFALLAIGGAASAALLAVVGVLRLSGTPAGESLLREIRPFALIFAFIAAAVAMGGSLYFSEIANFRPCRMCWIQRGFMYPLVVLIPIVIATKSSLLLKLVAALSTIGMGVSIYHRLEQQFPDSVGGICSVDVSCAGRYVDEFGFITIPTMACAGFMFILSMSLIALRSPAFAGPGKK